MGGESSEQSVNLLRDADAVSRILEAAFAREDAGLFKEDAQMANDKQATDKKATDKQATEKQATEKQATDKKATDKPARK